jgi:hypothetical protein
LKPTRSDHFCQRSTVAVERERGALGLDDLERLDVRRAAQAGHEPREVLAHGVGLVDAVAVLDLEQLHPVEVDDEVQPADGVRVGARARGLAVPDVGPPEPPLVIGLRQQMRAVGPGVDQDAIHVVDPSGGQRLDHARVAAQRLIALPELVDGHVRLLARPGLPAVDRAAVERDDGFVDRPRPRGSSR